MTSTTVPVSVVINTKNESRNIARVLHSVTGWVDEIIVCDMHSQDDTIQIAESMGAKVIYHEDVGYVEPARKLAVETAFNEWVLLLDADEVVDGRLRQWILAEFASAENISYDGVELPWIQFMSGVEIKYSDFGNHRHLRLFRKQKFTFSDKIHSRRLPVGDVKIISLSKEQVGLLHFQSASFRRFLDKHNGYAYVEAQEIVAERGGYDFSYSKAMKAFVTNFYRVFVKQKGHKDGLMGLHIALCMAMYAFLVRSYAYEISRCGREEDIYQIYDQIAKERINN